MTLGEDLASFSIGLVVFCHRFSCVLEAPCWQRFVIRLVVFSIVLAWFWYGLALI